MGYSEAAKRASKKYIKEKQTRVYLRIKNEEFESTIKPAIEKSGLPTATFVKKAIYEYISNHS